MGRLEGLKKNILMIIPKDYYDEKQLEIPREIFLKEGADVRVASSKFKEAVGDNGGRAMPDVLIVDSIEGITGDSYVTDGKGTRQIKGVFHGVVVVGGKGARKYLWKDNLLRILLIDRYKSNMVVGALGNAVPCLAEAQLINNLELAAAQDKYSLPELERVGATVADEKLTIHDRIVTAADGEVAEEFAYAMIDLIEQTKLK
ncbi:DJ-1/PfpI family protein [Nitrospina gracilis]|uniref:DJ-1/PfpI family protein n=1 Tax=Nitrospina gracilis TaxID=35801 RepID=UPI001F418C8C|nr:DJ-1/PfpI family protein [Nitrospina gracilis]MCF8721391.1 protease I [Nitrospina gracilis Nb-211]